MTPDLYHPVVECFVRGLPHVYRNVGAPDGTSLLLEISGECGGRWLLSRRSTEWRFVKPPEGELASRVVIRQELAWRVCTKGIDRDSALKQDGCQIRIVTDGRSTCAPMLRYVYQVRIYR